MTGNPTETTPFLPSSPSAFTPSQKRLIIITAALASAFSPLSSNIYYPALNVLASDLHVSSSQINLTITTYMITQALTPSLTASLSDTTGRRPIYIACFTLYITSNIALALCNTYPALLLLRALQSTGISGTVALSAAVAADIIAPDERGRYMGFTSLGNILAPSVGPVLGGLFCESRFGWRGVFWFLSLAGGVVLGVLLGWFPETRGIGRGRDGVDEACQEGRAEAASAQENDGTRKTAISLPNPLDSVRILLHLPTGLILLSNGIVFASYYAVTAGIPSQFKRIYGLSGMGIGLVFIPAGLGSLASATFNGAVVDWNYRRVRRGYIQKGMDVDADADADTCVGKRFPVEQARLQVGVPMTFFSSLAILLYGFVLDLQPPLALSFGLIFLVSFSITASYNVMNVLLVDLYYSTPATVMAANNFVRCFLGAASTALVTPMLEKIGIRKTYGVITGLIVGVCCPILNMVYCKGVEWRVQRDSRSLTGGEIEHCRQ